MAQPVGLYGSSGQRIADESVDHRPIPFRVGAGAHGVTGTGDHEPFLALAGACGDIAIQLPGINERIIRAVDEQHRHGGMRELCHAGGLPEPVTGLPPGEQAHAGQRGHRHPPLRQVIHRHRVVGELIPH